jgi:hypothetical protein
LKPQTHLSSGGRRGGFDAVGAEHLEHCTSRPESVLFHELIGKGVAQGRDRR